MLTRMILRDFRCLASVEVEPHPQLTFVVGHNAQGKTSLLEAVCVLMRLQSPRTSSRADWLRFGAESCLIEGAWEQRMLRHAQTKATRRLAVDGAVCTRAADYLSASALVVWLDHADMNLARGGAEHRRRHLDFTAAQLFPDYLTALRQYERALRARNFLLKRDANISWKQVDAYGVILDKNAAVITRCRRELVHRMQPWIADAQMKLSGARETATAAYAPGFAGGSLLAELERMRDAESRTRQTAAGTHRDDVLLSVGGRDAGTFASEGQQRTLSLALKLAQARVLEEDRGVAPLLLLDDVFGELDPERRRALLDYLPQGSQKIITTTFLDWMSDASLDAAVLQVDDGQVRLRNS
ncbi:MAG: DNA replication and repair protein RecF [Verrucomicrobia bacterium]|nr:DNA replication and repair protein RecF [Verrucomicrobiota bacterium]